MHAGSAVGEQTCREDRLARWQCFLSRLTWSLRERVEGKRDLPDIVPELVDYDAIDADCIVQAGLFGEVVYG